MSAFSGGERILDAVNLFGRTRLFEQHWSSMGLTGKCLDQRIGGMSHNILTKDGWFVWLKHLLQMWLGPFTLLPGVLICMGVATGMDAMPRVKTYMVNMY